MVRHEYDEFRARSLFESFLFMRQHVDGFFPTPFTNGKGCDRPSKGLSHSTTVGFFNRSPISKPPTVAVKIFPLWAR